MKGDQYRDDGTLLSTLLLSESFITADEDPMDIDHTINSENESVIDQSTPGNWKSWAHKEFATHEEMTKAEIKRDLGRALATADAPSEYETANEITVQEMDLDTVQESDSDDEYNHTTDSISSALSILSPTTLGAKFALKQKLLMPPPPAKEDQIDYASRSIDEPIESNGPNESYDESIRNVSSYNSSSDQSLVFLPQKHSSKPIFTSPERKTLFQLQFNSKGTPYDSKSHYRTTYGNEPSSLYSNNAYNTNRASMFTPPLHQSIQVHHHHYYASPQTQNGFYLPMRSPEFPNSTGGGNQNHSMSHLSSQMSPQMGQMGQMGQMSQVATVSPSAYQNHKLSVQERLMEAEAELPVPWLNQSSPHEKVPYVISSYIQMMLNFVASTYAAYLVYSMIRAIRTDISHKIQQQAANVVVQIASCRRSYQENHCDTDVVPATQQYCEYWLKCMSQNPYEGGNMLLISAETVGMIINSLVEPLGMKFLIILFGFLTILFMCNFMFGFFRAKAYYGWQQEQERERERERDSKKIE